MEQNEELPVADAPSHGGTSAPGLPSLSAAPEKGLVHSIDLLKDVPLRLTVELGRARLLVREVLALRDGSVVELDRQAGAAVDVLVNGALIARGEVVVVDERFGVRITEVVGPSELSVG